MLGMCLALVTEPSCDTTAKLIYMKLIYIYAWEWCVFELWDKVTSPGGDKGRTIGPQGRGREDRMWQAGQAAHYLLPLYLLSLTLSRRSQRLTCIVRLPPTLSPWLLVTPHSSSSLLEITKHSGSQGFGLCGGLSENGPQAPV